jgi:hypothetical protein
MNVVMSSPRRYEPYSRIMNPTTVDRGRGSLLFLCCDSSGSLLAR